MIARYFEHHEAPGERHVGHSRRNGHHGVGHHGHGYDAVHHHAVHHHSRHPPLNPRPTYHGQMINVHNDHSQRRTHHHHDHRGTVHIHNHQSQMNYGPGHNTHGFCREHARGGRQDPEAEGFEPRSRRKHQAQNLNAGDNDLKQTTTLKEIIVVQATESTSLSRWKKLNKYLGLDLVDRSFSDGLQKHSRSP